MNRSWQSCKLLIGDLNVLRNRFIENANEAMRDGSNNESLLWTLLAQYAENSIKVIEDDIVKAQRS